MNSTYDFLLPLRILTGLMALISMLSCSTLKESPVNYLGQKPPGMAAELFAPGIISTNSYEHSAPAFSPDGTVVLWTVLDTAYRAHMLEMKYENGSWTKAASPSFADTTSDDYYPSFSTDGKKLYFSSRRKMPTGYPAVGDMRIWEVTKTTDGWGKAVPFDTTVSQGQDYAHSLSTNGTLYFSSALGGGTNWNIQKSQRVNGHYTEPELLPYNINSVGYEEGPYIAPDESFLIFESQRPDGTDNYLSLYISFRDKNDHWSMPVNMGPKINSGKGERFARLSPDGKYLFFGSFRNSGPDKRGADIYWIDAKIIDELRNDESAKTIIEQPLGDELINTLYKNDVQVAPGLLKKWLGLYPNNLDAIIIYSSLLRKQQLYVEAGQLLSNQTPAWNHNITVIMDRALLKMAENRDQEATELLEPLLVEGDRLRDRYLYLCGALFDMKKFDLSDAYFEKAMSINSHAVAWYNRACGYTHIGQHDKAFKFLDKAAGLGYNSKKDYEADPDLKPLQPDARWRILISKLK